MPSLDPPPILMKAKNWKVPELLKALRVNIVTEPTSTPVFWMNLCFCPGVSAQALLLSTPGGRGTPLLVRWGESDPSPLHKSSFLGGWLGKKTWRWKVGKWILSLNHLSPRAVKGPHPGPRKTQEKAGPVGSGLAVREGQPGSLAHLFRVGQLWAVSQAVHCFGNLSWINCRLGPPFCHHAKALIIKQNETAPPLKNFHRNQKPLRDLGFLLSIRSAYSPFLMFCLVSCFQITGFLFNPYILF